MFLACYIKHTSISVVSNNPYICSQNERLRGVYVLNYCIHLAIIG